ncbi:TIGR04282 family arsenosugar biosynthesis glycosyltransferase [Burkholderiales bacterium]|nr:TIGR04282 family arsenosugar biosynthesis glycosyltransferase [Burkholderiales bacterium]
MTSDNDQAVDTILQIFTRTPVEGEVKTRLIPNLGALRSCELHKRMTLHAMSEAKNTSSKVEIWVTPTVDHPFFIGLERDFQLKIQVGKTLAERMAHSLEQGLKRYKKVILIGSDCPSIDRELLIRAVSLLDNHQYVFIPVEDGGFSLIGSVLFSQKIFHEVPWGSNLVMTRVRNNLKKYHYSWAELPTIWDIDDFTDYERLSLRMPHITTDL